VVESLGETKVSLLTLFFLKHNVPDGEKNVKGIIGLLRKKD